MILRQQDCDSGTRTMARHRIQRHSRTKVVLAVVAMMSALSGPLEASGPVTDRKLAIGGNQIAQRFVQHIEANPNHPDSAKRFITEEWQRRRSKGNIATFIPEALAVLNPRFRSGLDAFQAGEYKYCSKIMSEMSLSSDPYLALHATLFHAKSLIQELDLEFAELLLSHQLREDFNAGDYCFYTAELKFLQGFCQFHTFQLADAEETLRGFLANHPDAGGELRATAEQLLDEMERGLRKSLDLAATLMADAGLNLTEGEVGLATQTQQWKSLMILEELIRQAQDQEQQCKKQKQGGQGGKPGQARGTGPSSSPAQDSSLPGGESSIGTLHSSPRASPGKVWGQMRPREREKIMQALQENFPSRYRELVEQYYEELAKEK